MILLDLVVGISAFFLVLYLYTERSRRRHAHNLPLPPGPKKLPLIGNLLDVPTSLPWVTYQKWCKAAGIVFSLWM
jgi:hypothetical protein